MTGATRHWAWTSFGFVRTNSLHFYQIGRSLITCCVCTCTELLGSKKALPWILQSSVRRLITLSMIPVRFAYDYVINYSLFSLSLSLSLSSLTAHDLHDVMESEEEGVTPVFQKNNYFSSGTTQDQSNSQQQQQLYSIQFIKKYIIYAKGRIRDPELTGLPPPPKSTLKPQLFNWLAGLKTDSAVDHICQEYTNLRNKADVRY